MRFFAISSAPLLLCLCALSPQEAPSTGAASEAKERPTGRVTSPVGPGAQEAVVAALAGFIERTGVPGASVTTAYRGIGIKGGLGVSLGFADVEEKRPMPGPARMLSGSTGKTFVSAAALRLAEQGKLTLDDTLQHWLGDLEWIAALPNGKKPITLRQLLGHTSGIPEYYLQPSFRYVLTNKPRHKWSVQELLAYLEAVPAHFAPGEGWSYADSNYLLAGLLLERAAGMPFYEFVDEQFVEPLELVNTSPSSGPTLAGLVPGYTAEPNYFGLPGKLYANGEHFLDPSFEWCGGGFVTTSRDLAWWAHALYSGSVLEPESMAELLNTRPANAGIPHEYGLGVQVFETRLGKLHGHTGFFPGYLTAMGYFPDSGLAIALQVNTDDVSLLGHYITEDLVDLAEVALDGFERDSED